MKAIRGSLSLQTAAALQPGRVELWLADLGDRSAGGADWEVLLDVWELERARAFRFELPRRRFVAARGILRTLLGWHMDRRPEEIEFSIAPRGKPSLPPSGPSFNLSHSEDRLLIAIAASQELGIDIEHVRSTGSPQESESLARQIMHPEELRHWCDLPSEQRAAEFFRLWTAKEAILKATGEGIGAGATHFAVPSEGEIERRLEDGRTVRIAVQSLEVAENYAAALATVGGCAETLLLRFPEGLPAEIACPCSRTMYSAGSVEGRTGP